MSRRTSQHSAPDFSGAAPLTGAAADPELARKGGSVTAAESRAKAAALRRAQQAAKKVHQAKLAERVAPAGFRPVEHFLDSVSDLAGRVRGGKADLANYLAPTRSVSRWLKREKIPLQWTLDAMHKWYLSQRPKK